VYCETLKKIVYGHSEQVLNADIWCRAPPWQCAWHTAACTAALMAGAFQMRVIWPPCL
jgi:hypothetical protein